MDLFGSMQIIIYTVCKLGEKVYYTKKVQIIKDIKIWKSEYRDITVLTQSQKSPERC